MNADHLWVEKYRPKKTSEVLGNEEAKITFVNWLRSRKRRRKAVLLYGPPVECDNLPNVRHSPGHHAPIFTLAVLADGQRE